MESGEQSCGCERRASRPLEGWTAMPYCSQSRFWGGEENPSGA